MIAKAASGVLLAGLIGTGGVALAKPGWLGISTQPPSTFLEEDHDYSTKSASGGDYHNKFGSDHKDKLVGVYGKEANKDGNKAWWEWSFERLKNDKPTSTKFKYDDPGKADNAVTKPYANSSDTSSDKDKALNQVCYAVYKSDKSKIKENLTTGSTDEYKESEVWKYCSRSGKKPEGNN